MKCFQTLFSRKKKNITPFQGTSKVLCDPFHSISDFEVGDIVTVKLGVIPGGRQNRLVEEVGEMRIHGEKAVGVRVMGMPYFPEELILVSKKPKIQQLINGLWQ